MGGGAQPAGRGDAQRRGRVDEPAVRQQAQDLAADGARERVAAERAAVLARAETPRTSSRADDRRDRQDAAAERLAEHVDVGLHILVLAREEPAGAAEAGLDLVGDEQHAGSSQIDRAAAR